MTCPTRTATVESAGPALELLELLDATPGQTALRIVRPDGVASVTTAGRPGTSVTGVVVVREVPRESRTGWKMPTR